MHTVAISTPRARGRKINKRLLIPKLFFLPAIVFAMVSQPVYIEDGFWDTTWEVVSFLVLLVASFGRVWCSAYISGRKNSELVTEGPYSISRNPLYFFSFLGFLGAGLAFEKLSVAIAFGVLFFLTHWPTILYEERKLRAKFGSVYDDYALRTPRFLPRFGLLQMPDSVTFSPAIFNRAMLDCGLIMSTFILAHFIEYAQSAHWIPVYFHGVW